MDNVFVKSFLDLLHQLATIAWFGMLFANFVVVRGAASKTLAPNVAGPFFKLVMQKTRIIVYVSLAVLFITGIPLKIANANYVSIINFSNNWQIVMFVKHVFVAILALLALINFEYIIPRFQKLIVQGPSLRLEKTKKLQLLAGMLSVLLALIIIILSALVNQI
jgi:uncharacterized membrane protein